MNLMQLLMQKLFLYLIYWVKYLISALKDTKKLPKYNIN